MVVCKGTPHPSKPSVLPPSPQGEGCPPGILFWADIIRPYGFLNHFALCTMHCALKKHPCGCSFLNLFREEAGKFVVIGKAESVGFFAHDLVKFRKGCFDIGSEENSADAAAKHTENFPTDERKIQHEDFPFFSAGHLAGKFEGSVRVDLRIFRKDIGNHAVFIGFYDAGNHEKQAPEEDFDFPEEHGFYDVAVSSAFE